MAQNILYRASRAKLGLEHYCYAQVIILIKEALAKRRVFSLVGMIINTKFTNCTLVFKIGAVRQQNMQSKHQNTFQSNLS